MTADLGTLVIIAVLWLLGAAFVCLVAWVLIRLGLYLKAITPPHQNKSRGTKGSDD